MDLRYVCERDEEGMNADRGITLADRGRQRQKLRIRGEEIKVFIHGRSRARRFDDSGARICYAYREGDNVFKVRPVSPMVG